MTDTQTELKFEETMTEIMIELSLMTYEELEEQLQMRIVSMELLKQKYIEEIRQDNIATNQQCDIYLLSSMFDSIISIMTSPLTFRDKSPEIKSKYGKARILRAFKTVDNFNKELRKMVNNSE